MIELILILIICHCIGDYFLQNDFIAKTKGENIYHLFIHCILYIVPFTIIFNMSINILVLLITHFIVDILKAKYNLLTYTQDQIIHYIIIFILYL